MGEEKFLKFEIIKQTGDDGLPRHLVQIDIEKKVDDQDTAGGFKYVHEQRVFTDLLPLLEFLKHGLTS